MVAGWGLYYHTLRVLHNWASCAEGAMEAASMVVVEAFLQELVVVTSNFQ